MRIYKNEIGQIKFNEGLKMSLSEFKKVYQNSFPFVYIEKIKKDQEIEKAYKIAVNGNIETSSPKRNKIEPKLRELDPEISNQDKGEVNTKKQGTTK